MIDLRKWWHKPTAADRLQSIVDATRNSHEITEYRIRRAAALRGVARRRERAVPNG